LKVGITEDTKARCIIENGVISDFGAPYKIYIKHFTYSLGNTLTVHFPFTNPDMGDDKHFSMRVKAFIGKLLVGNHY
jgi:hypothetical protein